MNKDVSLKLRYSYNFAALLVLIMHCSGNLPSRANWTYPASKIIASLGQIGVPWFVFMAAYFLFRGYKGDYRGVLIKKLKTLLAPYLAWNIVGYFYRLYVFNPMFKVEEEFSFGGFLSAFIPFHSANGALWTVALLMIYMVITPLIKLVIERRESIYLISLFMVVVVALNIIPSMDNAIIVYLPMYLLGGWMVIHYRDEFESFVQGVENRSLHGQKRLVGNDGLKAVTFFCSFAIFLGIAIINYRSLAPLMLFQYLSPVIMLLLMRTIPLVGKGNWLVTNGSFVIYVSHGPFTHILCPLIYRRAGGYWNDLLPYSAVIISCLLLVAIVIMIIWLLRNKKWIWVFTGGRN